MGCATWSYNADEPEVPYLPVLTLPAKCEWKMIVTCEKLFLPHTHWLRGRTLPCMGDGCGACGAEMPRRPEGFVSVVASHNRKHFILRVTRDVAIVLLRHADARHPLRSTMFTAKRRGEKPNGHVQASVDDLQFEVARLPAAPNVELHLLRVWRVDGWEPSESLTGYAEQLRFHLESRLQGGNSDEAA